MIGKLFSRPRDPAGDARLRDILKQGDPFPPPPAAMLAGMEAAIMARIDALNEKAAADAGKFADFFQQILSGRMAAFASVALLAAGFLIGQTIFGPEKAAASSQNLSLIAFADETSGQFLPVADPSWAESDDDAQ